MNGARHIYAELFKTAASSKEVANAKKRALGNETKSTKCAGSNPAQFVRSLGKEAAIDPGVLRRLALLGAGGLGLAGGGLLAGRYLLPRDPSEAEALESIGISEPGEYSVGVSPDVFGRSEEEEGVY
jgi:hypothetical protein